MKQAERTKPSSDALMIVLVIAGVLGGLVIPDMARLSWLIGEMRMLAMVAGGCIGALFAQLLILQRRVKSLEDRLEAPRHETVQPSPPPSTPPRRSGDVATPGTSKPQAASSPASTAPSRPASRPAPERRRKERDGRPGLLQRWLNDGNLPVKIGVLVLFVGVASLLRHALDQGWLAIGIEWRLSGVALIALAALVFAWRERQRRRTFALSLQGGAVGVLALVVFAAFRLYDVLPALPAFLMLVVLTFATAVLSVLQAALALAVLAVVAGFSAPLLIATGAGNHLVLFGWYALLNLGIFAIAWRQSWPLLNRIGFAFTFVIATAWGVLSYTSVDYAGVQAFLLLFFALYFLIPVLHALRDGAGYPHRPDVMLVFGLPLFAFPLQAGLLEGERLPIAFSALLLATIYLAGAYFLLRIQRRPALGRSHAVLAAGFATLAVPFAFAAPTVAMIWALQGAALVWFGIEYRHRAGRLAGLALQFVAASVWLYLLLSFRGSELPILNTVFLGGLAVAVALTVSAWRYTLAAASSRLLGLLTLSALLIWLLNGLVEIDLHASAPLTAHLSLVLAAVTAAIGAYFCQRFKWAVAGGSAGLVLLAGVPLAFVQSDGQHAPLAGFGIVAWFLFIVLAWPTQRLLQHSRERWQALASLATHAAVVTMLALTAVHLADQVLLLGEGWHWLAAALPFHLLLAWFLMIDKAPLSPAGCTALASHWLIGVFCTVLVIGLLLSLSSAGLAAPLPYVPFFNPLEITQLGSIVLLFMLARDGRAAPAAIGWLGLLTLVALTWMILRGVHHLGEVPWSADALLSSRVGQASLSVGWTVLAVIAWVGGSRSGRRGLWLAGAVLLGLVLLKLLVVDRTFLSNLAGIVSFLAFGLLSILVGYLAPAPPRITMEGVAEGNKGSRP